MRSFEDGMFARIDEHFFLLCMASPEEKYQKFSLLREGLDN